MAEVRGRDADDDRIMLRLLDSVERDSAKSQRGLATELGIALGLVNAYLKRCVKKGLIKASQAPARHYAYYLTPKGFAEKSRLTAEYLSASFSFFRQARTDCSEVLNVAASRGWRRVALAGVSDLAEIATICAVETGMAIVAVVDGQSRLTTFVRVPVFRSFDVAGDFDAVVVTDLKTPGETARAAREKFDPERVLVPKLLGIGAEGLVD